MFALFIIILGLIAYQFPLVQAFFHYNHGLSTLFLLVIFSIFILIIFWASKREEE